MDLHYLRSWREGILWSAICRIILWAKVNSICHMSIFIHVASENVCAMPKSIYNMGNCTCHMLTFINVMSKFKHDMRYLIFHISQKSELILVGISVEKLKWYHLATSHFHFIAVKIKVRQLDTYPNWKQ